MDDNLPPYLSTEQAITPTNSTRHPKLTGYRLLVIILTASFGFSKAALSYRGESTAPTTLDWLYGVVVFLMLYWLGIYEKHALHNSPWLFEVDYLSMLWRLFGRSQRLDRSKN
ncbi:hypothetical protein BDQ12DRAFT_92627 [Crucibulum laeve]|uniref:Uncharacterized protein n=1 Tax=Crucibulum laeve TaxID=68775 RepID=A0A5C3LFT0_9AGAR|nr:hypothetical protein BDQ12DRAFT_92627 [Crucibulum laeve]